MPQKLISVTGRDRPGIISAVTGVFYKSGANLEDISMTILEGEFAMMMIVRLPGSGVEGRVRRGLENLEKKMGLTINTRPLAARRASAKHSRGTVPHLVTVAGLDRTGIVHRVADFFASKKMNITDLNSKILSQGKRGLYVLMLEVDIPAAFLKPALARGLEKLARKLRVDIQIKPMDPIEF